MLAVRHTGFWFMMCGELLVLVGHLAVRAAARHDAWTLRLMGRYGAALSIVGLVLIPSTPLRLLMAVSVWLLGVSRAHTAAWRQPRRE